MQDELKISYMLMAILLGLAFILMEKLASCWKSRPELEAPKVQIPKCGEDCGLV